MVAHLSYCWALVFHRQTQQQISSNVIIKDPNKSKTCHNTTLWNIYVEKLDNLKQVFWLTLDHKVLWHCIWLYLKCGGIFNYTVSQKNVPPLACYNFDTHEWILIFFGRNVTNKVGNEKTLYYATSSNLCFCSTWQNGKTRKSHFHSVGLCYTHNAPVCCLPERKSCHLWCVW